MDFTHQHQCLNCGAPLPEPYCSSCGQKRVSRISFAQFLVIARRGFFEMDSPIFRNLIELTIRPGHACRDYVEGKRKRYFNPVRYSFWLMTILMVLATLLGVDLLKASSDVFSPEVGDLEFAEQDKLMAFMNNAFVYIYYVNMFCFALVIRFFFRKHKYNVWELLLTCMFLFGHLTIPSIIFVVLGLYAVPAVQIFLLVLWLVYFAISIAQFYQPHKKTNYVKSMASILFGWILASVVSGGVTGVLFAVDAVNKAEAEKLQQSQQQVNGENNSASNSDNTVNSSNENK